MEDTLVAALSKRSALSEGDWITVEVQGAAHRLRVQQLKPKPQVSVIGKSCIANIQGANLCNSLEPQALDPTKQPE